MNPRERVLTAIDHHEPDRVPLDFGGTGVSSASEAMQAKIRQVLGLTALRDPRFRHFDNVIQEYFGCDIRQIGMRGPKHFTPRQDDQGRWLDEWGVHDYNDSAVNPLRYATIEDLRTFPWPDPYDPGRIEGIKEEAKFLHTQTGYAIAANAPAMGFFEAGCRLRGYDQFLLDFVTNQDFLRAFFEKQLELMSGFVETYVGEIGEYIDIIWLGDDACTQRGPYVSPRLYRQLVKPFFTEYIKIIKKYTDARIMHHCCGACSLLMPDYLDMGIEIMTPSQPEAEGMQPERLKGLFGERMTFHGGIGLQEVLPHGTPAEVKANVRSVAHTFGKGGGYILAAAHTPPDDVSAENIIAMLETARELTYPFN